MTWEGLVEALARQSAEMDRSAREGVRVYQRLKRLLFSYGFNGA